MCLRTSTMRIQFSMARHVSSTRSPPPPSPGICKSWPPISLELDPHIDPHSQGGVRACVRALIWFGLVSSSHPTFPHDPADRLQLELVEQLRHVDSFLLVDPDRSSASFVGSSVLHASWWTRCTYSCDGCISEPMIRSPLGVSTKRSVCSDVAASLSVA